ncbi:MAG TPA: glycosyltransferase family 39 protein [Candidatus Dormibacteraeota bacterium]|nr:glycosyltransferase family 39 protein [Candidatus Dormibacteraeota bacterium]
MIGLLVAITVALHLATSWRYGYFRDELYFIECARHLAWGYVDQPPLVAAAAWLSGFAGYSLVTLRLLPVLSAGATVGVACLTARELGGGRFAQALTGLAVMLVPAYLLLGNALTTTAFEPLSWTLAAYAVIRLIRSGEPRWWLALAAGVAFGLYGKYSMLLLVIALAAGVVLTPARRRLATWWFPASAALTALLVAPNALWQYAHGWPMLTVLHGDVLNRHAFNNGVELEYHGLLRNAAAFALEQVVYVSPLILPIWLTGLAALLVGRLAPYRAIGMAYLVLFAMAVVLDAKGYYIIGIYAVLVAAGSVTIERAAGARRGARAAVLGALAVLSLPLVPFSLPVLPVDTFIGYTAALHLTGTGGAPPRLMQPFYAEEFGWDGLARRVAEVYHALPPDVRARTGLFADTYADAGALAFYGPRYGLPAVISGQNTFYLWGTHGYDGSSMIAVGAMQTEILRRSFRHVRLVATYGNAYKWVVEGPTPIYLCSDPVAPLPELWPRFRWYGA